MSIFSDRIKLLRLEHEKTQSDMAKHLEVSVQSYSAYESSREPSYDLLCRLAKYFNVTTDYLLGVSDCRDIENQNIQEETGLSENAIKILRIFNRHAKSGNPDAINLINTFITDYRVWGLSNEVAQYSEMRSLPKVKEQVKALIEKDENEEYKKCDALVEATYGKGNAAILVGAQLAEYKKNYIKDTFFEIVDNHDEFHVE